MLDFLDFIHGLVWKCLLLFLLGQFCFFWLQEWYTDRCQDRYKRTLENIERLERWHEQNP